MACAFVRRPATRAGPARLALLTAATVVGTVLVAAGVETLLTPLGRRATGVAAAAASLTWAVGLLRATKLGR